MAMGLLAYCLRRLTRPRPPTEATYARPPRLRYRLLLRRSIGRGRAAVKRKLANAPSASAPGVTDHHDGQLKKPRDTRTCSVPVLTGAQVPCRKAQPLGRCATAPRSPPLSETCLVLEALASSVAKVVFFTKPSLGRSREAEHGARPTRRAHGAACGRQTGLAPCPDGGGGDTPGCTLMPRARSASSWRVSCRRTASTRKRLGRRHQGYKLYLSSAPPEVADGRGGSRPLPLQFFLAAAPGQLSTSGG